VGEKRKRLARDFDAEMPDIRDFARILANKGRVWPFNRASHPAMGRFMNGANKFAAHPAGSSHDR
jgi:hypothetical protein